MAIGALLSAGSSVEAGTDVGATVGTAVSVAASAVVAAGCKVVVAVGSAALGASIGASAMSWSPSKSLSSPEEQDSNNRITTSAHIRDLFLQKDCFQWMNVSRVCL